MEMEATSCEKVSSNRIAEFYNGKYIFLTGSSGYLGSVILELFLRCFPGIQKIFILMRTKKGVSPEIRKDTMFKKKIFRTLIKENPDVLKKVHTIPGDVSQPDMGVSEEDMQILINQVTVVIHCGASISFLKSLRGAALNNSLGTYNVILFCRKLKKLEALVYTSTAYSFANYTPDVEEIVYRLPFDAKVFVEELKNGTKESFEKLLKSCKPDWPNHYTFSKALSENILQDLAPDLPYVIIRPSIICAAYKGILPGYIEQGSSLNDHTVWVGKGFIRITYGDPQARFDFIPNDIAANAHVVAAWGVATGRIPHQFVINATGGHNMPVTSDEYFQEVVKFSTRNLSTQSFFIPQLTIIKSKLWYRICALYEHYLPALIFEAYLRLSGKKLRLLNYYRLYDKIMLSMDFFVTNSFEYEVNNMEKLSSQMNSEEEKLFSLDFKDITLFEMVDGSYEGSTIFEGTMNDSVEKMKIRRRSRYIQTVAIDIVKKSVLVFLIWLVFCLVSKLYRLF